MITEGCCWPERQACLPCPRRQLRSPSTRQMSAKPAPCCTRWVIAAARSLFVATWLDMQQGSARSAELPNLPPALPIRGYIRLQVGGCNRAPAWHWIGYTAAPGTHCAPHHEDPTPRRYRRQRLAFHAVNRAAAGRRAGASVAAATAAAARNSVAAATCGARPCGAAATAAGAGSARARGLASAAGARVDRPRAARHRAWVDAAGAPAARVARRRGIGPGPTRDLARCAHRRVGRARNSHAGAADGASTASTASTASNASTAATAADASRARPAVAARVPHRAGDAATRRLQRYGPYGAGTGVAACATTARAGDAAARRIQRDDTGGVRTAAVRARGGRGRLHGGERAAARPACRCAGRGVRLDPAGAGLEPWIQPAGGCRGRRIVAV
jgi:hypothetical protein